MDEMMITSTDIEGTVERIRKAVIKGRNAHKEYEELQGKDPSPVLAEYDTILSTLDKFDNEIKLGRFWSIRDSDLLELKFKLRALQTLVDETEDVDVSEFYLLDSKIKEAYWDYRDICDSEYDDIDTLSEYSHVLSVIRDVITIHDKYKGRLTKGTYDSIFKLAYPLLPKVGNEEK